VYFASQRMTLLSAARDSIRSVPHAQPRVANEFRANNTPNNENAQKCGNAGGDGSSDGDAAGNSAKSLPKLE